MLQGAVLCHKCLCSLWSVLRFNIMDFIYFFTFQKKCKGKPASGKCVRPEYNFFSSFSPYVKLLSVFSSFELPQSPTVQLLSLLHIIAYGWYVTLHFVPNPWGYFKKIKEMVSFQNCYNSQIHLILHWYNYLLKNGKQLHSCISQSLMVVNLWAF